MKAKSALIITCLGLAFLMTVGVTSARADSCCYLNALAAPFVAAGAIVEGAVVVTAAVVTAPFTACGGGCAVNLCNPCSSPKVSWSPGNYGQF
ncbi:MAG: hypothetical protein ABSE08_05135 [Syntrophobacteraceae bacterium]|jgi:hypothetical protein